MLFDGPYRFPKKPKEPKVELEFPKRWWDSTPKIEIDIKKKKKYTFKYTRKWSYIHDYQPKHSWIKYNIFYTTKANWVLVVYNFYSRKNIFWEKKHR